MKSKKKIKNLFNIKPVSFVAKPRKPKMKNLIFGYDHPKPARQVKGKLGMNWVQAKRRYPNFNPLADTDRDGVQNFLDCRPFDKRRQSAMWRKEIQKRIKINTPRNKFSKARREHGDKYIKQFLVTKEKVIRTLEREPYLVTELEKGNVSEIKIEKREPTQFAAIGPVKRRGIPVGKKRILRISDVAIPGIGIGEILMEEKETMSKKRAEKLAKGMMISNIKGEDATEQYISKNFKDEEPEKVKKEIRNKAFRYNMRVVAGKNVYPQNISDSIRHEIGHLIQEQEGKVDMTKKTSPERYIDLELDVETRAKYPDIRRETKPKPELLKKHGKEKYYHGTTTITDWAIKKEGLKPSKDIDKNPFHPDMRTSLKTEDDKVYIFKDPKHARTYAEGSVEQRGMGRPIVLQVDADPLELERDVEMKFGEAHKKKGKIDPEDVRTYEGDLSYPDSEPVYNYGTPKYEKTAEDLALEKENEEFEADEKPVEVKLDLNNEVDEPFQLDESDIEDIDIPETDIDSDDSIEKA